MHVQINDDNVNKDTLEVQSRCRKTHQNSTFVESLEQVRQFTNLGVPFDHHRIRTDDLINSNLTKFQAACDGMRSLGIRSGNLPGYNCLLVWRSFCRSTSEYGLAVSNLSAAQVDRVDRVMAATLKRLLGVWQPPPPPRRCSRYPGKNRSGCA